MGQARLERQNRFAVAQLWRVYGCVMVATKKTGGRNVSRPSLWRADVTEDSGLHTRHHRLSGYRHRREHGGLQRRQRRVMATAALCVPGTACGGAPGGGSFGGGFGALRRVV